MPKLSANRWKFIAAAALLLTAAVVVALLLRGPQIGPGRVNLVCVATGRQFSVSASKIDAFPAKSPETGQRTLLPCETRNGRVYVGGTYRVLLAELREVNKHVDPKTGEVRAAR